MKNQQESYLTLTNDWHDILKDEFTKDYFLNLQDFIKTEYETQTIYPKKENIFNALNMTSFIDTKVVILGQDPYHGEGQAHGLSFSVQNGITPPPSLVNIYKELESDINITPPNHGNLTAWTKQGVLLLNTVFTVRAKQAHSHKNKGWEKFTDKIIKSLDKSDRPICFVLWGKPAQKYESKILSKHHLILKAPHPSPLSSYRGFWGCKHFSKINEFLTSTNQQPIDWKLDDFFDK